MANASKSIVARIPNPTKIAISCLRGSQIQFLASFDVDAATGAFIAQFTNADRSKDASRCKTKVCPAADVCRTLPEEACVVPSLRASTVEEFPDWVPNVTPPPGYSLTLRGCAVDDAAGVGVITAPTTFTVEQPRVTVEDLTMTGSFITDKAGGVRATGSLSARRVLLGTTALGKGKGTLNAILLKNPPPGVPPAPPRDVKDAQ